MSNNESINTKTKKSNNLLFLIIFLILLLVCIGGAAYAKYIVTKHGSASAQVAKMICNLNVQSSSASDQTIVNPYCTVTLTNFNTENNVDIITEASYNYTVTVSLAQGSELTTLPVYYWEDSNGNRVGTTSQPLTGTFLNSAKDTQVYKVYFVNTGSNNITADIDFNVTAVQKSNN